MLRLLKKHPIALFIYMLYLLPWGLFVAAMINIGIQQQKSGTGMCMTGPMTVMFLMIPLSFIYLVATLLFAAFGSDRKFFLRLSLAVAGPLVLLLLTMPDLSLFRTFFR